MERLNMETIEKISLLYDFYGRLLTEKQRQVMELYHEENLSLAEIAEESSEYPDRAFTIL